MELIHNNISVNLSDSEESAMRTIRAMQQERNHLTEQALQEKVLRHRRTITKGFKYDLTDNEEYNLHARMVKGIADNLMLHEFDTFVIDEHNANVMRFLLYYFNNCPLAEKVFPDEHYKLHKNILLIGEPGTGKTMLMQVFSAYLEQTYNENAFRNISATQLLNYHKVNGHIDKYTYNECGNGRGEREDGSQPFNVCLNDLGLATEGQKSYGTVLSQVIDEFLFARYEIYQQQGKRYHITSNLMVRDFKKRFEGRLVDRFKSFNVITLTGGSRRK